MNLLDKYQELAEQNLWDEALPIIENIIAINADISTSWFNYGVCLEELQRYNEAAQAFIKAYEINQEDYAAQYRVFRNFALAENKPRFKEFLLQEMNKDAEVLEMLAEDLDFSEIISQLDIK